MRIGIDIDGTVTEMPWFFSLLAKSSLNEGHQVYIISYRHTSNMFVTQKNLQEWDIPYTKIFLSDQNEPAHRYKEKIAKSLKLDMMFEDDPLNLAVMPQCCKRVLVGKHLSMLPIPSVIVNPIFKDERE